MNDEVEFLNIEYLAGQPYLTQQRTYDVFSGENFCGRMRE